MLKYVLIFYKFTSDILGIYFVKIMTSMIIVSKIMTPNELQKILDEREVPQIMYIIDVSEDGDCLCVVNNSGG